MMPTTAGILWLHQSSYTDHDRIGNKAARLGNLSRAGFQVPAGFSLPSSAYRRHVLEAPELLALIEQRNYAGLRAQITGREIDPEVKQALLSGYRVLLAQAPAGVAVRSSSTAEDLDQHSFAGLYSSILGVNSEAELLDAVRACWASYWNDEAAFYREQAGIQQTAHGMGVLVQAMVPAVLAGVLYTRAAGSGGDVALIEYTREGGEALVSGETRANRLFVNRKTGRPVRPGSPQRELDVSRLVKLGLQLEDLLGAPQDVEWAMDAAGGLWILQSRPVTSRYSALPGVDNGAGEWLLTYDEPFSPLGCEIAMNRYRYWVKGINANFKTRFQPQMEDRGGLLYYLPTWRKARLPLKLWMNFWRAAAWLGSEWTYRRYVNHTLPAYIQQLQAIEQADLSEMSEMSLLARLREVVQLYLDFQYTSYAIGAAATLSAGLLDRACKLLFKGPSRRDALDFLTGLDDVSIQRELEVYRLGQLLQPYLPLTGQEELSYAELAPVFDQDGSPTPLQAALQDFLGEYGYLWADRYPRDPAWEINQEALAASLWIAARAAPEQSLAARHRRQQLRREEAVELALDELDQPGGLPIRRLIFSLLLRRAEKLFPYKESRNHYTYKGMLVVRRVAREFGRRLQARQLLPAAEDLFYLRLDEIEMLSKNPRSASWLLNKVNQRKETYLRSRSRVLQKTQPVRRSYSAHDYAANGQRRQLDRMEAIEVKGDPCSPGLAQGPARLVSGPGELQQVRPGEIIVCTQLRPAWSSVFSRAGGVVIEMGSLLSHGSALAREYGIPAVINVTDITGLVRENDWLTVDGNLGKVAIKRSRTPLQEQQP